MSQLLHNHAENNSNHMGNGVDYWQRKLTRSVLVACVFCVVLEGGRFHAPSLTRLLGHVAIRGKRQSKERQKS